MSLSPGDRLGLYEIATKLGEGGPPPLALALMGELRRGLAVAKERTR